MLKFTDPDAAIAALAARAAIVETGHEPIAPGRVPAQPIVADRDSPAADVSAMDGYAVRIGDLSRAGSLPVAGEQQPGRPAEPLPPDAAIRIFTGAVVPPGSDAVVKREDVEEDRDRVRLTERALRVVSGENIRRRGENVLQGGEVLPAGTLLTSASIAAAISFGAARATLYRRVNCSVIVTGNEVLDAQRTPEPWQLRDSNGPTVVAMVSGKPWLKLVGQRRCGDDRQVLRETLASALETSDAVFLTGGVSKGDYDFVPWAAESLGCETVFHHLPIRPGKPVFGAVAPGGKLVLGLPGNPVSAACVLRRIGMPLLRRIAGCAGWQERPIRVRLSGDPGKTLPLHWMRLARLTGAVAPDGVTEVELVASKGSGDLVALGISDGFVEQPPHSEGGGPWPFFAW